MDLAAARTLARDLQGADVDVVINNAGYGLQGEFVDSDEAKVIAKSDLTCPFEKPSLREASRLRRGQGHRDEKRF